MLYTHLVTKSLRCNSLHQLTCQLLLPNIYIEVPSFSLIIFTVESLIEQLNLFLVGIKVDAV